MNEPSWALQQVGYRQLEVFCQVVESGNFSAAARELDLNQSTVSRHVKQLEELFDTPLLVRQSSGHDLTELGELIYRKASSMLAVREDFEREVLRYFKELEEELVLGASTIPGEVILPRMLSRFQRENPDLSIRLEIADSREILRRIEDGELRFGLVGTEPEQSSLRSEPLFRDEMKLIGLPSFSGEGRIGPKRIRTIPYVGRGEGSGTQRAVVESLRESSGEGFEGLNIVARLSTIQAVREAVLEGMGVSFLPIRMIRRDLETGGLAALDTSMDPIKRTFYSVRNSFLGLPPMVRKFKQFLNEHALRDADYGTG